MYGLHYYIDIILPHNTAYRLFYSEYGAYAGREYIQIWINGVL